MSSTRTWGTVKIHHYWTGNYTQQHIITNATLGLILVLLTLSGWAPQTLISWSATTETLCCCTIRPICSDLSSSFYFFIFLQKVSGLRPWLCGCICLFLTGNCFIWLELPALPEESIQLIYLGCLGSMALDWMQFFFFLTSID